MGQLSESKKQTKSVLHTAVITEDTDGGVTRRKAEENSSSTIFSFLAIPENEKSVLTICWSGIVSIIFG